MPTPPDFDTVSKFDFPSVSRFIDGIVEAFSFDITRPSAITNHRSFNLANVASLSQLFSYDQTWSMAANWTLRHIPGTARNIRSLQTRATATHAVIASEFEDVAGILGYENRRFFESLDLKNSSTSPAKAAYPCRNGFIIYTDGASFGPEFCDGYADARASRPRRGRKSPEVQMI